LVSLSSWDYCENDSDTVPCTSLVKFAGLQLNLAEADQLDGVLFSNIIGKFTNNFKDWKKIGMVIAGK
jgi:hypothetical protein